MAYDDALAARVQRLLAQQSGWSTRRMFGGLAFLLDEHLAVAVGQSDLMVRCDPAGGLLDQPHTAPTEMGSRPMAGWLNVTAEGVADDAELARWVAVGVARVRTLYPGS